MHGHTLAPKRLSIVGIACSKIKRDCCREKLQSSKQNVGHPRFQRHGVAEFAQPLEDFSIMRMSKALNRVASSAFKNHAGSA
ncbi:MAG: hypothetical protein Q4A28_04180 [Brachymonas sp.]|nr:hypothetical protein [Brachymonas sp.]